MKWPEMISYDVETRMSNAALARLMKAVLKTQSSVGDCYIYDGYKVEHTQPVLIRVKVPDGKQDLFTELSGCVLQTPPNFVLNVEIA